MALQCYVYRQRHQGIPNRSWINRHQRLPHPQHNNDKTLSHFREDNIDVTLPVNMRTIVKLCKSESTSYVKVKYVFMYAHASVLITHSILKTEQAQLPKTN